MKRTVLVYGILGGVLIAGLKLIEYRFLVIEHSFEVYGGLVALVFSAVGIWLGLKLTRTRETLVVKEVVVPENPGASGSTAPDPVMARQIGLTPRELEILALIATELTNREIAEKLYVSENTVKTHSSRVFGKLNARRRTEAVRIARGAGLIP